MNTLFYDEVSATQCLIAMEKYLCRHQRSYTGT